MKYVSIIRDPVERVISEYFWWKSGKRISHSFAWPAELKKVAYENHGNFTKWILHENNTAHNRQFKTFLDVGAVGDNYGLDGVLNTDVSDCANINSTKYLRFWKKFSEERGGLLESGSLENDLKTSVLNTISENFLFVGLTEKMDSSEDVFSKIAKTRLGKKREKPKGWVDPKTVWHESTKSEVTDFQRSLIRERNRLDIFLYEKMKGRFDESVKYYA